MLWRVPRVATVPAIRIDRLQRMPEVNPIREPVSLGVDPVSDPPAVNNDIVPQIEPTPSLEHAFLMLPPGGAMAAAERLLRSLLGNAPRAMVRGALLGPLGAAALELLVPSRAGDPEPPVSSDPRKPSGHGPVGEGHATSQEPLPTPQPQPDPGAAGARKGGDAGVPPAPSRATEFVRSGTPELDDQVAQVRSARESGDPAAREALRQREVEQLNTDIADLRQRIPFATEPERGVLTGRLHRAEQRLRELHPDDTP